VIGCTTFLVALALSSPAPANPPLLRVLSDTGQRHNGLPVLTRYVDADRYEAVLLKGFSGALLHVYLLEQRVTHPHRAPRPAYLVLTDNQGGFPRSGFELDGQSYADVAFVDLHRRSTLTGRYGAIDQIFPHELMHIIVEDFAGAPPDGPASQVHAVGVQTDRGTAFNEGLAETAQILSIDDPDAAPDTHALAQDARGYADARARFDEYFRAMTARWNAGARARMTFPFWFSQSEQVLRYHAIRANLFSRTLESTEDGATPRSAYAAYLVENVVPAPADAAPKTPARMMATEGVVAALFWRVLSSHVCRATLADIGFYSRFGVAATDVTPLENALLKLFASVHAGGYDTVRVIRAYTQQHPDEAADVNAIVADVLHGQPLPVAPELWVRNSAFRNGRSLFDQFRAIPRAHTFDLNAASRVDLVTVTGVDDALAREILRRAPFQSADDLATVPGVTPELLRTFRTMREAMQHVEESAEAGLTLKTILKPYAWRGVALIAVASLAAALLYRLVRRARWWRLGFDGVAAGLCGLLAGWSVDQGNGALAFLVPLLLFGAPATAICLWRTRSLRDAIRVTAAWTLASLVPAMIVRPL
jgi:DNA uptake protein ComE-like DNA-binding protein